MTIRYAYLAYDCDDIGEECGPHDETSTDGVVPRRRVRVVFVRVIGDDGCHRAEQGVEDDQGQQRHLGVRVPA